MSHLGLKGYYFFFFSSFSTLTLFNLQLDVAIDGADDVDSDLNAIKGGGYVRTKFFTFYSMRDGQCMSLL